MTDSINNPLRIAEIPVGTAGGMIGISFAPGKKQISAMSGKHDRDLDIDLNVIAAWNASAVLTLVEDHELRALQIEGIGNGVKQRFMEWHHWPICDVSVPSPAFEQRWATEANGLVSLLARGERVLVHCKGGLGRAGMIAARLLVEAGEATADRAIAIVREVRKGAIETFEQEQWVAGGRPPAPSATSGDLAAVRDRAIGALVGLAVGDAVGTTIEFSPKPMTPVLCDMVGGGPFNLEAGQWTDDTSMALALADSLIADPALLPGDLMDRFLEWRDQGRYSCTGRCFDIGNTVSAALRQYERTGNPIAGSTHSMSAGNGALMRLSPVAIRHWRNHSELIRVAELQTQTTHGASEAIKASRTFAKLLALAIEGRQLNEALTDASVSDGLSAGLGVPRSEIRGSGYVHHSLQAALWCVSRTTSFRSAILMAANLGEDADTTAAIAGQLAGAVYGASGIPTEWRKRLAWSDRIEAVANQLFEAGNC